MGKREYYRLDRILEHNAQYNFLIGMRANGKSYSVKEYVITRAFNDGEAFIYLRRYGTDVKQASVESYFGDMPIKKLTRGTWDGITAYHSQLYFYRLDDDTDKMIKSPKPIGRYFALSNDSRIKSQTFEDVTTLVYEEVIPIDNMYLPDEPTRLQQTVSSIFRDREGKVFMIGNTLSRVSPYVKEFCLDNFLRMKVGDIDVYNFHVQDSVIKIAVEYCAVTKYENKMFFGQASKQILSGEWEVQDVNKLPKPLEEYEKVYEMMIEYQNFKFILNLLVDSDNGGKICFIYPYTSSGDSYKGFRILTDRFSTNPFISARLDLNRTPERYIRDCFALNKLCYSDNLTGSDFKAVNEHFHICTMF